MGDILSYKVELTKAMTMLASNSRTLFIGQNVVYGGAVDIPPTLAEVPANRKIEFPVAEDLQMGVCIGLALTGWLPVCIYPRMDFLLLALNQLVNHLDKFPEMSAGRYQPKVIIRVAKGHFAPLNPGPQHCQDYTEALKLMLKEVKVFRLTTPEQVLPAYEKALRFENSTVLIELMEMMR